VTDSEFEPCARSCVILGSGFSRAISDAMPTMPELGVEVLDRLRLGPDVLRPFGDNLEQWMSYLSVDQPWLDISANYENRALFARVSEAVQLSISEAEHAVMETTDMPDWLLRLVWTWCDARTQVFSFNYDTLLERAVGELNRLETWGDLYAASLSDRLAAGDGAVYGAASPSDRLLSLYKLHGSTSWSFGGLDSPPNDRILLTQDRLRWHRPPAGLPEPIPPRDESKYDDVVPLIIPPTLTKGPYFSNLTLRAQWRRAADALRAAPRLTVIGYSFPQADLVAQQWVTTSFAGSRFDVVDRAEQRPAAVRATLAGACEGDDLTGDDSIEQYVNSECGDLLRWRVWDERDGHGARASLKVNGVELVVFDLAARPWGDDHDQAQRWVHDRVEEAEPGIINRAIGPLDGSGEGRWAVLSSGNKVRR
jgi:hypothetical protein